MCRKLDGRLGFRLPAVRTPELAMVGSNLMTGNLSGRLDCDDVANFGEMRVCAARRRSRLTGDTATAQAGGADDHGFIRSRI